MSNDDNKIIYKHDYNIDLKFIITLNSEQTFRFELIENNSKRISIFECRDINCIHDIYNNTKIYQFKNLWTYKRGDYKNIEIYETDNLYNILNYISSPANKIIERETEYFIKDDIIEQFKNVADKNTVKKTSLYGVIDKDKILFPNKYDILNRDNTEFLNSYKAIFNNLDIIEIDNIKNILYNLHEYIKDDEVSKLVLEYSITSIFKFWLLKTQKLNMFPHLILIGKSGYGKTMRISLLYSQLFMNIDIPYSADFLKGSGIRLQNEGWVTMPMWVDEIKTIPYQIYDILKMIATKPLTTTYKYTINQTKKVYISMRPLIISTNQLIINDIALNNRCLTINADSYELQKDAKYYNDIHKKLYNNIHLLGKYIYQNINIFINEIENLNINANRETTHDEVLKIGSILLKKLFNLVDIKYKKANPIDETTANDNIILQADKITEYIIDYCMKHTKILIRGIEGETPKYIDFREHFNSFSTSPELKKIGIFQYINDDDTEWLFITAKAINTLQLSSKFQIKKLTQLANIYNTQVEIKSQGQLEKTTRGVMICIS